jgi:hypothetical protein
MNLSSDALTTIAACEEALSVTAGSEDSYLARLIEFASSRIKQYCNRTFYWEDEIAEFVNSGGTNDLVVTRRPVTSITSVEYDDGEVDSDDYKCVGYGFADAGIIYNANGWIWAVGGVNNIAQDPLPGSENPRYTVTYDGGWVTPQQVIDTPALTRTLPWDLEQACIDLVVLKYTRKGVTPGIKSEKLLSWAASYETVDSSDPFGDLPASIKGVLGPYRNMVIA